MLKILRYSLLLITLTTAIDAYSQADTGKPHYMYSFIAVNVGYGTNLTSTSDNNIQPFFGTTGITINISGLLAFKEAYWGIPVMIGYSNPGFNVGAYAAANSDTNKLTTYTSGSAGRYSIYYLLSGLNLKLPQRTTREAVELRIMVGPLLASVPAISYSGKIAQAPNFNTYQTYTSSVSSATTVAFAISPGIGLGYKFSKHLALMAYSDLIFAALPLNLTTTNTINGTNETKSFVAHSSMAYVNFTASLAYSFGNIKANIAY